MGPDTRPALLFYCQHALGIGHLVRSLALAAALAERFRVVLLNGGRLPECVEPPPGIELIDLPSLGLDLNMQLVSHADVTVPNAQRARQRMILDAYQRVCPAVLLIELFPFGRKKFARELLPLLEEARKTIAPPLVACSLRDILVSRKQTDDDTAVERANQYFDTILVHADPTFARLEESFHPQTLLRVPVQYTGFVSPEQKSGPAASHERKNRVVVSAGGGLVGEPLLRAAIEAHPFLHETEGIEMKVIAGPFLPEAAWQRLCEMAKGKASLQLIRSVPDVYAELSQATASVSQCGYNTAIDVLRSGVSALVVPFDQGSETEQMNRARRLEHLGLLRVLKQDELTAQRLAEEVRSLLLFKPKPAELDLNGAKNATRIIEELLRHHSGPRTSAHFRRVMSAQ